MNQTKKIQNKPSKLELLLKDCGAMLLNVNVVPNITGKITSVSLTPKDMKCLKNMVGMTNYVADTIPSSTESSSVDMLIGNDY